MSDLDPKELVVKNKVLVVCYALAILPIILWFVLVGGGAKGEFQGNASKLRRSERAINSYLGKIKAENPSERPYTKHHIEAFTAQKAGYNDQVRALQKVVVDRDAELEKWFEDPLTSKLEPGKSPKANDYITLYRTQIEALVKEYEAIVTPEGGGAPRVYSQEPPSNQLHLWQKRFWVQKYVLQAIQEATQPTADAGGPLGRVEETIRFGGDMPRRGEEEGGSEVVERIGAAISLRCRFSDVPKVVERILAQPITFQILRVEVSKVDFMVEKSEYDLRVDGRDTTFSDPYYTGELENHEAFEPHKENLDHFLPEPSIKLSLELEVLDFKVELTPEPSEEGGEGEGGN
jgi:hypothetical protein